MSCIVTDKDNNVLKPNNPVVGAFTLIADQNCTEGSTGYLKNNEPSNDNAVSLCSSQPLSVSSDDLKKYQWWVATNSQDGRDNACPYRDDRFVFFDIPIRIRSVFDFKYLDSGFDILYLNNQDNNSCSLNDSKQVFQLEAVGDGCKSCGTGNLRPIYYGCKVKIKVSDNQYVLLSKNKQAIISNQGTEFVIGKPDGSLPNYTPIPGPTTFCGNGITDPALYGCISDVTQDISVVTSKVSEFNTETLNKVLDNAGQIDIDNVNQLIDNATELDINEINQLIDNVNKIDVDTINSTFRTVNEVFENGKIKNILQTFNSILSNRVLWIGILIFLGLYLLLGLIANITIIFRS